MYIEIQEPTEKISPNIVRVWRISNTIGHLLAFVIIAILILCSKMFQWFDWITTVLYILALVAFLSAFYSIIFEPAFLQRTWRFKIDEEFVQLKHGRWYEKHTLIPMEKVEYVRTEQGPLLRGYRLYNIEIGTTTENHVIPGIPTEEATRLKSLIATYAKVQDKEFVEGEQVE